MNGKVISGSRSGARFRDDRYGTVWELVAPAGAPCQRFGFAYVEVDPGRESPLHYHAVTEELYHIVRGDGVMTLGDTETPVGPGDTVAIPSGERHRIRAGAAGLAFVCVTVPPYDPHDDFEV
jgi:mannose-6-phosphate isomerase-like protein (cupin superfamily)